MVAVDIKKFLPSAACMAAWLMLPPLAGQSERVWHFDHDMPGQQHSAFELSAMRQPSAGRWTVERQGMHGYFAHHAESGTSGYAMALVSEPTTNDVGISVRLRFPGAVRTGGLVWRAQNSQTFYALVLDLVARQLSLYKMTDGNRIQIDVEDGLELDPQTWHALKVVHQGAEIRVSLGGVGVFHERDRRDETPGRPVRVGLLAAGAAEVWFDDLRVEPKKGRP